MTDPHARTRDSARPEAVAKRHALGKRTARENIADLCDADSFLEYGALAIAAQRSRRALDELERDTPADGLVGGVGRINGDCFDKAHSRCVVMSYDYTVLAGTQGYQNHRKTDRLVEIARREKLPVVFFTEGGGGRPGDTDAALVVNSGLEVTSFYTFARLSGEVPLIGINAGRCFAGNAAFFGCCDITIATRDANLGMAGPAMIAGGGLGEFGPEDIGPADEQAAIGVVDIVVTDEAEAVATAKQCLSYFQGPIADFRAPQTTNIGDLMPANRRMTYDVRRIIAALADSDSMTELGATHAPNLVTAFIRIAGRPLDVIANNPRSLAGAIDSAAARKAAAFMRLCDTHGIALLTLCDTPGIMVGPEAEKTGTVAHAAQLFIAGAKVNVPWYAIVLRKAYGLGAQAMLGGHLKRPDFTVAWPNGEFGPMGVEGAVTLGFRRELAAIEDETERAARYQQLVDGLYEQGKAENVASYFEIDDVIDPAESRRWLAGALGS
ncbi:Carbamoyl-phosphate synthase L chain ATP-binding protein [Salinisphaera sp. S4-8]|uniref:acyl-CoA carboxylase subunit beta n=1 Tax=Salinisphaera sp. S4-8 TaxID=633357 RepID=UPI00333E8321